MGDRVAIATMLDNGKRAVTPMLIRRWGEMTWDGADPVVVACCYDADDALIDQSRAAAKDVGLQFLPFRPQALKTSETTACELATLVDGLAEFDANPHTAGPANAVYLHKVAILREATRQAVLSLEPAIDWCLWLDSDVDPRAHAWVCLRQVLTETTGPLAPQVACGIYATRMHGKPILQQMDRHPAEAAAVGQGMNRYIPLLKDRIGATQVAGFGCTLMRRDVLDAFGWVDYTEYRRQRRLRWELDSDASCGLLGEDVWWFRRLELATGMPPIADCRVRCRHYHGDGSYWRYDETDDGHLVAHFITDEQDAAAAVPVRNVSDTRLELPAYQVDLEPGAEALVSPEILLTLQATWPGAVQLTQEAA